MMARHEMAVMLAFLTAAIAAGVWAVAATQEGSLPGGTVLFVAAATALFLAALHGRECLRLRRMARTEAHWDAIRMIRPRL